MVTIASLDSLLAGVRAEHLGHLGQWEAGGWRTGAERSAELNRSGSVPADLELVCPFRLASAVYFVAPAQSSVLFGQRPPRYF